MAMDLLMESSMEWMRSRNCSIVSVMLSRRASMACKRVESPCVLAIGLMDGARRSFVEVKSCHITTRGVLEHGSHFIQLSVAD